MPASARQIDFYFDFPSPYSYLASTQLPKLAAEHGVDIVYRPFRILEVMKIVGNRPTTVESPAKGRYAYLDIRRWAKRYGVPLQPNPKLRSFDFPLLGRLVLVANEEARGGTCAGAIFPAVWAGADDLTDHAVLARRLDAAGLPSAAMIEKAGGDGFVTQLQEITAKAAERGVFGAPTVFVGDDMFFGNDRLDFVAEALTALKKAA